MAHSPELVQGSKKISKKVRPSDEVQREFFLYALRLWKDIPLPIEQKFRSFESLLEDSWKIDFWPIVGITTDALQALADNNWNPARTVQRGHDMPRIDRARMVFGGKIPEAEVFDFWRKHDQTIICTKAENPAQGTAENFSMVIPLEIDVFGWHTGWGMPMNKAREAILRELLEKLNEQA